MYVCLSYWWCVPQALWRKWDVLFFYSQDLVWNSQTVDLPGPSAVQISCTLFHISSCKALRILDMISAFAEFFLQPIIKDRPNTYTYYHIKTKQKYCYIFVWGQYHNMSDCKTYLLLNGCTSCFNDIIFESQGCDQFCGILLSRQSLSEKRNTNKIR